VRCRAAIGSAMLSLGLVIALSVEPAAAQGKSGQAPGKNKPTHPGGGPPTQAATPTPATASLESWLDDATPVGFRTTWVSLAAAEWSSDAGRMIDAPIVSVVTGVAPRLSLGASLPAYYFQDPSGSTQAGIGDVPLFAKIMLVNPAASGVGVAITPLMEVSSETPAVGASRVTWAVPVSVEARMTGARVYASGGYFSSGAVFGTGALEVALAPRLRVTGSLGESYATNTLGLAAGTSRHRIDTSVMVTMRASRAAAVFAAVGHAFSGQPTVDGGPWIAGGLSFQLSRR
jgi:hypothetical protein